jgi:hypothetical protein
MRTLSWLVCIGSVGCSTGDLTIAKELNGPPVVLIDAPRDGTTHPAGEAIEWTGKAADSNGLDDIAEITWRSDLDGVLATLEEAPLDADGVTRFSIELSAGIHFVHLKAEDYEGLEAVDYVRVTVAPAD